MRWERVISPDVKRGPWSEEEDVMLMEALKRMGHQRWNEVAKEMDGRTYKQCRERYMNYLREGLNMGEWEEWENNLLLEKHKAFGNKWATISTFLKGRSENMLKNQFYKLRR
ncbi:unnamed protein product, partial [Choristocarpus tenellus]